MLEPNDREILNACRIILKYGPVDPTIGICSNLDIISDAFIEDWRLHELFITWKHFSGHNWYPVPCSGPPLTGYEDHKQYGTLWVGVQRVLRISLLEHMIKELEKKDADEM